MSALLETFASGSPQTLQKIGWLVTLLCVLISARVAFAFLRNSTRLFTVMSLFAFSWMMVLSRYTHPEATKLAAPIIDLASFLDVYIGGLLVLEGRKEGDPPQKVSLLQRVALVILLFIALPRAIELPGPLQEWLGQGLNVYQAKVVVSTLLDVAGYLSVAIGASVISRRVPLVLLVLVLGCYGVLSIALAIESWQGEASQMPAHLLYAFALGKLAYTLLFGYIVAYHAMSDEEKARRGYFVRRFFTGD